MTTWRLEWLRLVRTKRWMVLVGIYGFFGVLGPLTARYLSEILESVGGGLEVTLPDPIPADGISQYIGNAQQLGLLAVVLLSASALALDSSYEMAVFLRTRVTSAWQLFMPRYVVNAAAGVIAFAGGTVVAVLTTIAVLGSLDLANVFAGTVLGGLYLAFVVAVVAAVASRLTKLLSTALITVAALLVLPIIGLIRALEPWLPSHLLGALDAIARGGSITEYWQATAVTLAVTVALLWLAQHFYANREL